MEMAALHTLDKVEGALGLTGREFHGGAPRRRSVHDWGEWKEAREEGERRAGCTGDVHARDKNDGVAPARSRRWRHTCARRRPRWRPSGERWKKTTLPPVGWAGC